LLNRDRLFNRKKMKMAPIALELEALEESEARLLDKLGLKKRARAVKTISQLLNEPSNGEAVQPTQGDLTSTGSTDPLAP
jgi:hypothetical protein